ncbi:MAG: SUMF1/EgtB/PvdO family nonheme iron enzyme [Chloroflexota bacterium]|nr:SUMF1/EgtB/PvdO family nonheme iron enzyme [Chloroflexota bacterium]
MQAQSSKFEKNPTGKAAQRSSQSSTEELLRAVCEVRSRTLELVADLSDEQMAVPLLRIINPPLWEIGHTAWFQEKWTLRHLRGLPPIRPDGDALYDSAAVVHDTRWGLALPSRAQTLALMQSILDTALARLQDDPATAETEYFYWLSVFHEDMHDEALTYTRQTLGYPPPRLSHVTSQRTASAGALPGDVEVPGGVFSLGSTPDGRFAFDNEKWAHPVELAPYRIARAALTQREFAAFVDDGGYGEQRWWTAEGWAWRLQAGAEHPPYWRREAPGRWLRRDFDRWLPLEDNRPVIQLSWFEAQAYCRWANRRLPSEAEWEMAAAAEPEGSGSWRKRRYPWGDSPPTPERANLDWQAMGCVDVGALPAGDSHFGCRQMLGNVWEWTADAFGPYPGFVADPYKEYSQPWFGDHKVLRGGCWTTRSRLIHNSWRNFYKPDRRDVWAGFRTCAL